MLLINIRYEQNLLEKKSTKIFADEYFSDKCVSAQDFH